MKNYVRLLSHEKAVLLPLLLKLFAFAAGSTTIGWIELLTSKDYTDIT
jgi:hypothetical protein